MTMEAHHYNVNVKWEKDRKGILISPELNQTTGNCIEKDRNKVEKVLQKSEKVCLILNSITSIITMISTIGVVGN